MTVAEIRKALETTRTVILPIGCTEQHGYHLPTSVDTLNASELAWRISEATGCMVAPVLPYSFSGGELSGTVNVCPQAVSLFVMEICESLLLQGFKNIIVLLGHGGTENTQAIRDAVDMLYRRYPHRKDFALAIAPFWEMSDVCRKAFAEKDFHAGWLETSLMLFWRPDLVREERVLDGKPIATMLHNDQDAYLVSEKPVNAEYVAPRKRQHPGIKVGVFGEPSKADAAIGERAVKEILAVMVRLVRKLDRRAAAKAGPKECGRQ